MKRYNSFSSIISENLIDKAIEIGSQIATRSLSDETLAAPAVPAPAGANVPVKGGAGPASALVGSTVADPNLRLSPNFTLGMLIASTSGSNISQQKMPSQEVIKNLTVLCTTILEPIVKSGIKIKITSGWRSPQLNAIIRSSSATSYHMHGLAVDMQPTGGGTATDLFDKINALNLPVQELFCETNKSGSKWVHVAIDQSSSKPKQINRSMSVV